MPLTCRQLVFSGRTYQVEVVDSAEEDSFWVFLQLAKGLATDMFCSCGKEACVHCQFASKLLQGKEPLHEGFEHSFWKNLFFELQTEKNPVETAPGRFEAETCVIETKDPVLESFLRDPPQEIETNSIKFCDRTSGEIERWRQGRASADFLFELSIWSDIAKHYFVEEVIKKASIRVEGSSVFVNQDRITTYLVHMPRFSAQETAEANTLSWSFEEGLLTLEGKTYKGASLITLFQKKSDELRLKGFPLFEKEAPLPAVLGFNGQNLTVAVTGQFFGPYAYVPGQGFFLKPALPPVVKDLSSFIHEHPHLFTQEGFALHASPPKIPLEFRFTETGIAFFSAEGFLFNDWIYLPGDGFYPRVARGKTSLWGLTAEFAHLESFIQKHEIALEQVPGFFIKEKPFARLGLKIEMHKGKIITRLGIDETYSWKLIGPYFVVIDRGVYRLEEDLPPVFRETLQADDPESFIKKELPALLPYTISLDPRLRPLSIRLITTEFGAHYESDVAPLDLFAMAEQVKAGRSFYLTPEGYVDLRETRFEWLQKLEQPALSALDRIRLEAYEKVEKERLWPELKPLPEMTHFQAELRGYQQKGLGWLWGLYQMGLSALLCDDMGLGKTYQALALMAAISKESKGHFLILAPTSVIYHWYDKVRKSLPSMKVALFHGPERTLDPEAHLIITTYGMARIEREKLKRYNFEMIIFDEVQMAKNRSSLTWLALAGLKSHFRLGLTGTPIENNLKELKSLFDLVLPGFLGGSHRFREQFITPIELQGDAKRKELLQRLISPFILRRKKQDCLQELPSKTEDVVWCELSEEQQDLYQKLLQERTAVIAELQSQDGAFSYITLLALLIQLKKICNHPALFLGDIKNYKAHSSSKWVLFEELLCEALEGGQKVVVFSHYLGMLDIIESYLKEKGIGFASLRGSTVNRHDHITRFQTDPQCQVFVASLQAGGLGIDLTAGSTVIHYDRWWNAARENQATDRVYRIGQKFPVQVFKLATMGTVEENIDKLIAKKARLLDDIIALDGHTDFKKLTHEDWLQILSVIGPGDAEFD